MAAVTYLPDLTIGAFWAQRPEMAAACAGAFIDAVEGLRALSGAFDDLWYNRDSPRQPRRPFVASHEAVTAMLAKSVSRRDDNREVIPELGFYLQLDSGLNRLDQLMLSISCGKDTPLLWNNFIVKPSPDLPRDQAGLDWLESALRVLVRTCEPDWARIDSLTRLVAAPKPADSSAQAGWVTYLREAESSIPVMPSTVTVTRFGAGVLIRAITGWFDHENEVHVAIVDEVDRRLREARLLPRPDGSRGP